uniref:Amino acid transporter n=1 Tax=Buteo japonicus TaxID=224669 RepID=A0A8C0BVX3_9AVES
MLAAGLTDSSPFPWPWLWDPGFGGPSPGSPSPCPCEECEGGRMPRGGNLPRCTVRLHHRWATHPGSPRARLCHLQPQGIATFWHQAAPDSFRALLHMQSMSISQLPPDTMALLYVQEKQYFSFPGELLMRMLKMLILPLITSSLMSGLATMESKACGKMGMITITYYLWTTFMAVTVGIILVVSIHPGAAAQKDDYSVGKVVLSSADALLDLIRNMFPSNLIEASFQQVSSPSSTTTGGWDGAGLQRRLLSLSGGSSPPTGWIQTPSLPSASIPTLPAPRLLSAHPRAGTQSGEGAGVGTDSQGHPCLPSCFNDCCALINNFFMLILCRYFPFGIVFLIAGKILEMGDPSVIGQKLGLYAITVVSGLVIHGLILLPLLFMLITKKNPFAFIQGILQALLIALATSSSSATLPITLKCLLENNGIDRRVARFVLPVGATINMDGTALYEAVAAIFIAQVNEYDLDLGQIITISITATAASIGAAGIPQSGLVTMVIVLTSVGLPTDDITLIIAVDWALDRFRTMTNVLGDALAAGIVAHVCEKDFAPKPPKALLGMESGKILSVL